MREILNFDFIGRTMNEILAQTEEDK